MLPGLRHGLLRGARAEVRHHRGGGAPRQSRLRGAGRALPPDGLYPQRRGHQAHRDRPGGTICYPWPYLALPPKSLISSVYMLLLLLECPPGCAQRSRGRV